MYKELYPVFFCVLITKYVFAAEHPTTIQHVYIAKKTAELQEALDADSRDFQHMEQLLKEGANPCITEGIFHRSCLWRAVCHNQPNLGRTALEKGAHPDETGLLNVTPLMCTSSAELTTALIAHRANVNQQDATQSTPLHHQANRNHTTAGAIIALLCAAGADQNAQDNEGNTPMHLLYNSSKKLKKEPVIVLSFSEADPTIKNGEGDTALDSIKGNTKRATAIKRLLQQTATYKERKSYEILSPYLPFVPPLSSLVMGYAGGLLQFFTPEVVKTMTTKVAVKRKRVNTNATKADYAQTRIKKVSFTK